jgi:N-acetylglutamate synthase-like GNAT family acetyltransferase
MARRTRSKLSIRLADLSEHAALENLMFAASVAVEAQREALLADPSINSFPAEQIADDRVYVAERGGEVVGFFAVLPREDGNAELDGIFVRPDVWRSGVGAQLMDAAEVLAMGWGAVLLYVVANPHAELFYRACGFEVFGEQQTLFNLSLLMKKSLGPL